MTDSPPLIVTRPQPGNAATVGRAKALGLDARAIPLFAARPVEWDGPCGRRDFDALLLTERLWPRDWPDRASPASDVAYRLMPWARRPRARPRRPD